MDYYVSPEETSIGISLENGAVHVDGGRMSVDNDGQTIPSADTPQIVYLDFDGARTSYTNTELGVAIDDITVEPSGFGEEDTAAIAASLNGIFDDVVFTTEIPSDGEYSTIYIGVTSAFDEYGGFLGLAETIDSGNRIHDDNAFVLLDSTATTASVVSVIAHETEHIVHGMDHGGEGLARHADPLDIIKNIDIDANVVSTGLEINTLFEFWYVYGTAVRTTVNAGWLNVESGGRAVSTTVNERGNLWVSSGGTAVSTTVNKSNDDSGMFRVYGGTAVSTTVNGGFLDVFGGGTASSTTVNSGGSMDVSDGGTANSTTVNSDGSMFVSGGSLHVSNSGTANDTTINGGDMFVSTGGTANRTIISGFEKMVIGGGYLEKISGFMYVRDGVANSTTVTDFGQMYVSNGGTANDTNVNGGAMFVSTGGTANRAIISGFESWVYSPMGDYTVENYGEMFVHGGVANSTTLNTLGCMYVDSGGSANSTTVNSNGWLHIYNGTVESTTLNFHGSFYVYGGTANTTTVNGGFMYIYDGATANATTISGGSMNVSGTATDTTVNSGGSMKVANGGTATGVLTLEEGAYFYAADDAVINFDISALSPGNAALINNLSLVTGTPSYTVTVSAEEQSCGDYLLAEGAAGFDTTITVVDTLGTELGTLTVGGDAVKNGMTKYTLALDNGSLTVTAKDIILFTGDLDYEKNITDAILASGVNVNDDGLLRILSGGMAEDIALNGGDMEVSNGGAAKETTVNSRCRIFVESGGSVENTTVNSSGWLYVSGGATADGTTVNQNGSAIVYADGVASGATVNSGGYLRVDQGGAAHDIVENGGGVFVNDGADVTFKPNAFSELEMTDNFTTATVHSGTTANKTTLNGSGVKLEVYNGGTAIDTTVQNGWLEVRGGVAESVAIGSGGSLWLYPDAKLTGQMTFEDGAVVIANGAVIDFDISAQRPDNAPLVNNLSLVKGTPSFTVTVAESQAEGKYVLAGGAAGFNKTLTVFTAAGETLGTITVGDTNVSIGEQVYSLLVSDSQLLFNVGELDTTPPNAPLATASTTEPTNQNVTVSAVFSDDSVVKEYSFDGQTWSAYTQGIVMEGNGTVSFRGTDVAGNVSEVTTCEVSNIDKVAPAAPTVSADITDPTNQNVTVTAVFSDDSTKKEYSLDGEAWSAYTQGIVFSDNGTVSFRGTDAAGNVSDVASYEVTNIDKVAPTAPTASADITDPTNQNVTVSAVFSDDSAIKEYSLDGQTWSAYTQGIVLSDNGTVSFRGTDAAGNVSEVATCEVTNIDKVAPEVPTFSLAGDVAAGGVVVTATWDEANAECLYSLDGQTWSAYTQPLSFSQNATVQFKTVDAAGNESAIGECAVKAAIAVEDISFEDLGNGHVIATWPNDDLAAWADGYDAVVTVGGLPPVGFTALPTQGIEVCNAPDGDLMVAAKPSLVTTWPEQGKTINVTSDDAPSRLVAAEDNGIADVMFGRATGVWNGNYRATNTNLPSEKAKLKGKNRIGDLYFGSNDTNVILLTDDANGDVLFLDDIYSAFPDGLDAQARLSKIDSICAGAGDDVIDLTSQRFEYVGRMGMAVLGGDGDDVIWANQGNNLLFGDGGNDRLVGASDNDVLVGGAGDDAMHGGGGDDLFVFGGDWGKDTVTQLADGKVTLWFKDGDESKWDASTLAYADGANSVQVSGVDAANVSLKFGDDGSEQYQNLLAIGAFEQAVSDRLFRDDDRGMLA